jgi:coenzyme F420 hydrogenase subunit beta
MKNVNIIKESQLCSGCGTCNVVCNKDAITMKYDNIGRLLPVVNESKCVNCGLCYSICPSLDQKGIQLPQTEDCYVGNVINTYIGKSCDERIYRNSQSGGLVTAVLKYLFDTGKIDAAIVCKVIDDIKYTSKVTVVTSFEELFECQKSSYVPIDMVSALKGTDRYQSIAIVGIGCHIQGINALSNFKEEYGKRISYTLGLICERTLCKTSTDVLYNAYFKKDKKRIIWKDKSVNYKSARLLIKTEDGKMKVLPRWQRFVLKDPFTNPRCRICFDKLNVHADMVFGDPWGMSEVDWQNGMSLVLTRSKRGENVISGLMQKGDVRLNKASLSEVIQGQHIEKRKRDVSVALSTYQRQGWVQPSYAERLEMAGVSGKSRLPEMITRFVEDTCLSKEEIVRKNIKMLRWEKWKRNRILLLLRKVIKI